MDKTHIKLLVPIVRASRGLLRAFLDACGDSLPKPLVQVGFISAGSCSSGYDYLGYELFRAAIDSDSTVSLFSEAG